MQKEIVEMIIIMLLLVDMMAIYLAARIYGKTQQEGNCAERRPLQESSVQYVSSQKDSQDEDILIFGHIIVSCARECYERREEFSSDDLARVSENMQNLKNSMINLLGAHKRTEDL